DEETPDRGRKARWGKDLALRREATSDAPGQDLEKAVRRRLQGVWDEVEENQPRKEEADIWWDFISPEFVTPNLVVETYHNSEDQQTQYTLRLNTRKSPMWLDLFYSDGGNERVMPTIFKFDGDRLILIEGKHVDAKAWKEVKGNLPGRPKEFMPTKKSGYARR